MLRARSVLSGSVSRRALATQAFNFSVPPEYQSRTPPYSKLINNLSTVKKILKTNH